MKSPLSQAGTLGVCATSLLALPAAHAEITASDAAGTDASGDKLDQVVVKGVRPLIDDKLAGSTQNVPQSVTVVSSELMSAQANTRLEDALKNVPGITLNAGEGSARGDTVNLRGFSAFNDFFLDGIRDAAVYTRDSFDLESVEVVKGPSAILFGPRLDRRCDQPGEQGAESCGNRLGDRGVRHQSRVPRDHRHRCAVEFDGRVSCQCHGGVVRRRGPRLRQESALGSGSFARARHRRGRFADRDVFASTGKQSSRCRHPVLGRSARSGAA